VIWNLNEFHLVCKLQINAMSKPGFSVRILLQDGEVEGARFLEIANWTGIAILSPRDRYLELRSEPEFDRTGVYILTGPNPTHEGSTRTYIGRADQLRTRIDTHIKDRDWWDSCLCFTTSDDSLTLTHIQFLEAALLDRATKAGQVTLDNVQFPPIPRLGRADLLDLTRFLENVLMLSGMAGLFAFEIVDQSPQDIPVDTPIDNTFRLSQYEFHYQGPGGLVANAKYEARKRFVVMQNSVSRLNETNSCPDNVRILRQKLRDDGVLGENSGVLTFTADHAFNSPSLAAAVVYGGSVNGRSAWVDADGKTINDIDKISLDQQEAIDAIPEVANEPTCEESG
jgi:hypothetical protein